MSIDLRRARTVILPRILRPLPAGGAVPHGDGIGRIPVTVVTARRGSFIGEILARQIADDGRWDHCAWLREPPDDPSAAGRAIADALGLRCAVPGDREISVEQALEACASGSVLVVELTKRCPGSLGRMLANLGGSAERMEVGLIVATRSPVPAALAAVAGPGAPIDTARIARAEARRVGIGDESIDRILKLMPGRNAALHDLAAAERWPPQLIEAAVARSHTGRGFLRSVTGALLEECGADEREALDLSVRTGYWHPRFSAGSISTEALRPWLVPLEHEWGWVRPIWRRPLRTMLATRPKFRPGTRKGAVRRTLPVQEDWQPTLDVRLLGPLEIRIDGQLVNGLGGQLGSRLLRYLLLRSAQSCPRDKLIDVFWPESDPELARNRLQVAFSGLRRTFRTATNVDVVEFADGAYRINPALDLTVDVAEFERLAGVARRARQLGDTNAALDADRRAVRLYRGDLCADLPYEDWTIFPRERLRMLYGDALDRLADAQWRTGDLDGCTATAELILEQDPCREDAHRLLMRCYVAQGRHHQALRQFDACRRVLLAQLATTPSRATLAAYWDIRVQDDDDPPTSEGA